MECRLTGKESISDFDFLSKQRFEFLMFCHKFVQRNSLAELLQPYELQSLP